MKTIKCITGVLVSVLISCFSLSCATEDLTTEESVQGNIALEKYDLNKKGFDNKSTVDWEVEWEYWLDVECGDWTDQLIGPVTAHVVTHYKDGEAIGTIYHTSGIIESANTDEVFIVTENSFDNFSKHAIEFHFNIRGNMGTHYVGKMTWEYDEYDPWTGIMITRKFLCLENGGGN